MKRLGGETYSSEMTTDSEDPKPKTDDVEGCQFSDKEDGDNTTGTTDSKVTPTK